MNFLQIHTLVCIELKLIECKSLFWPFSSIYSSILCLFNQTLWLGTDFLIEVRGLGQSYNDLFVLTNISKLVMLFEIANKNQFPFPVQSNAPVGLMKHPTISRKI